MKGFYFRGEAFPTPDGTVKCILGRLKADTVVRRSRFCVLSECESNGESLYCGLCFIVSMV